MLSIPPVPIEHNSRGSLTERIAIASAEFESVSKKRITSVNEMSHSPEVIRHKAININIIAANKFSLVFRRVSVERVYFFYELVR